MCSPDSVAQARGIGSHLLYWVRIIFLARQFTWLYALGILQALQFCLPQTYLELSRLLLKLLYVLAKLTINLPLVLQLLPKLIRHVRLLLCIQPLRPLLQLLEVLPGHPQLALALHHLILDYLRPLPHLLDLDPLPIYLLLQRVVLLRPLLEHPRGLLQLLLHLRQLILHFFDALPMHHL